MTDDPGSTEPDPGTIAAFRSGDLDALARLCDRYRRPVWAAALAVLGDPHLAEDAAQDAFLRAWRFRASFDPSRKFTPWLMTIARRTAVDVHRREALPYRGGHEEEQDTAVVDPPSLERIWEEAEIRLAVDRLSEEEWAAYLDPDEADPAPSAAERAALDRIRGVLAAPETWAEPPADLTARVLALAAADPDPAADQGPTAASVAAATSAGATPGPAADQGPAVAGPVGGSVRGIRSGRRRGRTRWVVAASGVAAAVAVLLAVVLWPRTELASYPVAGTAAEPAATATVTLDPKPGGVALTVAIKGLPPSTPDTYYAAWLLGPTGTVPVGSFHWRKGGEPIDLWSGVEAARYPTFFITRQREGAPPTPSDVTVLTGTVR